MSARIVEAATQLMLEHGYGGTSIEAIAAAAGVAKRTVYHRFADKRDLFAAIIQHRREQFLSPVTKISAAGGSVDDQLRLIGHHILDWGLKVDAIAMRRLMTAESERFPDLLLSVYEEGRIRTVDNIATVLERAVANGTLAIDDTRFAAQQFLTMVMGPTELLTPPTLSTCTEPARRAYVEKVVDLFLHGCRPRRALA